MTSVYVIAAEGTTIPCKVGIAINPVQRARELSCGSPRRLIVLHSFAYPTQREARAVECAFHRLIREFPPIALNGEWADMEAADIAMILRDTADLFQAVQQIQEAR